MLMPGGRHDASLDSSAFGDFRRRRGLPTSLSSRTLPRYKRAGETNLAAWTDVADVHEDNNYSSADNIDSSVDVDRHQSTTEDISISSGTSDRGRSRLNKFIDVVGKPFARRRSKSVDAVLVQRRPYRELSPPASTDDQLSHSGSTSMLTLTQFANGQIPGTVGIRNHGNTCFMNSIIQCLSNTEFFAEYFVTNQFQAAVLAAQKAGRVCAITKQLSRLLTSLWTCDYTYQISAVFRAVIGHNAVQYQGTEQNDAQEFLQWLLDCVNEELYGTGVTNSRALYSAEYKVFLKFAFFQ